MHADQVQHAELPEHSRSREAVRATPLHLVTMDEEVAHAVIDVVIDRPIVGVSPVEGRV